MVKLNKKKLLNIKLMIIMLVLIIIIICGGFYFVREIANFSDYVFGTKDLLIIPFYEKYPSALDSKEGIEFANSIRELEYSYYQSLGPSLRLVLASIAYVIFCLLVSILFKLKYNLTSDKI